VRLAWRITNEKLSARTILDKLAELGREFPAKHAVKELWKSDCYQGWTEELRYFFWRYEEYLAKQKGQKINDSQWNRIWKDEPSRSIEHIRPSSKSSEDPSTPGIFAHRLGNLVLLPPGVNSKLQDQDPDKKCSTYLECGLLIAIEVGKLLRRTQWSRSKVEKREKRLMNWAMNEWAD